jgi:spore coat polysaccharide biosynthesis protein SpsF
MGSKRLPGKVLLDISGAPMLAHVVQRTRRAHKVDTVLVATTSDPADDPIAGFCKQQEIACYRGSQFDVLDRYYQAARQLKAQVIVRITADCPIIDPELIDQTLAYFLGELGTPPPRPEQTFPWDFAANRLPPPWGRTYPIGLDTEVCSFAALETAWQHARQPHQREHVMPYLYEFSPVADSRRLEAYTPPDLHTDLTFDPEQQSFRVLLVNHSEDLGRLRWTVDTPEDLQVVRGIFQHFSGREHFSWLEVLEFARTNPGLFSKNAAVPHKQLYDIDARGDAH